MKLEAKQRLESAQRMRFVDKVGDTLEFTQVTDHGVDGNGASIYSGLSKNGHPSVFIVKDGIMLANSIGDCKTLAAADAKAEWAVENQITHYWDSTNPKEMYFNCHHDTPRLVK